MSRQRLLECFESLRTKIEEFGSKDPNVQEAEWQCFAESCRAELDTCLAHQHELPPEEQITLVGRICDAVQLLANAKSVADLVNDLVAIFF